MATDTEAEFRCGRVVAFRKTGDFPTRAAARRMMPGDLTDALE